MKTVRDILLEETGGRCWYCGANLKLLEGPSVPGSEVRNCFCIDHLLPRSRGGTDDLANLVSACFSCNSRKGTLLVEEFRLRFYPGEFQFRPDEITALREIGFDIDDPPPVSFYGETGIPLPDFVLNRCRWDARTVREVIASLKVIYDRSVCSAI